ncbi:hypothetical protein Dsin_027854 [Dipteronia sinensis]|uniref:Uncharacterized protein n=1 Tax=Dipteronia sinensis TaxID=43782 RepID=A0AAD9ZP89_9ROSI|nr:hypothetical protein Dsin_027854 [Dipteronia sinensis]
MTTRLLEPIIVLQNHNRYIIMEKGHYYTIDIEAIEREHWMDESEASGDSILKHKPLWATYNSKHGKEKKKKKPQKKEGDLYRTYGTRVIPVCRNTIYARVDSALRRIRETSESVQAFAAEYLKKKTSRRACEGQEEQVKNRAMSLEEQLVDLSSLLYDHRLQDAHLNSSEILQSTMFIQQYVDRDIVFKYPVQSSQTFIYGGILIAGFLVYFLVIFFSSPVR